MIERERELALSLSFTPTKNCGLFFRMRMQTIQKMSSRVFFTTSSVETKIKSPSVSRRLCRLITLFLVWVIGHGRYSGFFFFVVVLWNSIFGFDREKICTGLRNYYKGKRRKRVARHKWHFKKRAGDGFTTIRLIQDFLCPFFFPHPPTHTYTGILLSLSGVPRFAPTLSLSASCLVPLRILKQHLEQHGNVSVPAPHAVLLIAFVSHKLSPDGFYYFYTPRGEFYGFSFPSQKKKQRRARGSIRAHHCVHAPGVQCSIWSKIRSEYRSESQVHWVCVCEEDVW